MSDNRKGPAPPVFPKPTKPEELKPWKRLFYIFFASIVIALLFGKGCGADNKKSDNELSGKDVVGGALRFGEEFPACAESADGVTLSFRGEKRHVFQLREECATGWISLDEDTWGRGKFDSTPAEGNPNNVAVVWEFRNGEKYLVEKGKPRHFGAKDGGLPDRVFRFRSKGGPLLYVVWVEEKIAPHDATSSDKKEDGERDEAEEVGEKKKIADVSSLVM